MIKLGQLVVFWDVDKFYDSIEGSELLGAAEKVHYPTEVLYLGMLVHMEPRMLKIDSTPL